MDHKQRIEVLERTVVILARTYTTDPDVPPEDQVAMLDVIISTAKAQALEDMETARRLEAQ